MFRIHWLAVTEMPSDVCILGRPTWVAAMSMAQVDRPAAAASTAKRLTAASMVGAAGDEEPACVLVMFTFVLREIQPSLEVAAAILTFSRLWMIHCV